mmetsp:Transcript_2973/g.10624  ORF Transcript_2973/g.10624 Transcript_2973/m.10624 type:complete len:203 (+) Transcript_2973:1306-1914(+)
MRMMAVLTNCDTKVLMAVDAASSVTVWCRSNLVSAGIIFATTPLMAMVRIVDAADSAVPCRYVSENGPHRSASRDSSTICGPSMMPCSLSALVRLLTQKQLAMSRAWNGVSPSDATHSVSSSMSTHGRMHGTSSTICTSGWTPGYDTQVWPSLHVPSRSAVRLRCSRMPGSNAGPMIISGKSCAHSAGSGTSSLSALAACSL